MRFRIHYQYIFTVIDDYEDIEATDRKAAEAYAMTLDVYVVSIKPVIRVKPC
ncbi:hypothetical protein [Pseudoalteromonas sp. S16_S37]|uniref:hypothetical protein n=1 Tax=Pseudoalteromonas sp. S16_S37 TaxID=2720228 RepID=UPI0016811792|nr:hypothetical protein [Pseudoalteromonas sp. S16_S37]MBD1584811.1 hypothetical protein [Pseudoalteromonas sp. S16_S37]